MTIIIIIIIVMIMTNKDMSWHRQNMITMGIDLFLHFCSKENIWSINCAQATSLIFDSRMEVLVKVSIF